MEPNSTIGQFKCLLKNACYSQTTLANDVQPKEKEIVGSNAEKFLP